MSEDLLYRSSNLISAAIVVVVVLIQHYRSHKRRSEPIIKKVPGALPIVGNSLGKGGPENLWNKIQEWIAKHGGGSGGGFLEFNLFGSRFVIACNNDAMEFVSRHRPFKVRRFAPLDNAINSVGATGLFSAEGKAWQHDRRLVGPALNKKNVEEHVSVIQKVNRRLVEQWRAKLSSERGNQPSSPSSSSSSSSIAINNDLLSLSIDIISLLAFDVDYDCLRKRSTEAEDLKTLFRLVGIRGLSPIQYWNIPIIGQYLDGCGWVKNRMEKSIYDLIRFNQQQQQQQQQQEQEQNYQTAKRTASKQEQQHPQNNSSYVSSSSSYSNSKQSECKRSLLAKLISLSSHAGDGEEKEKGNKTTKAYQDHMTPKRLFGNMLTVFLGGTETITSTTCRCLWELVNDDTGLLQDLTNEARGMGDDDFFNGACMDTIQRYLPKLRSLFYEVVRLYGPTPFLFLESSVELREKGNSIAFPAGTCFILPYTYVASTDPACGVPLGPNKEPRSVFCPRRWLVKDDNCSSTDGCRWPTKVGVVKPSAKMGIPLASGFGTGARMCPGQDLAELEVIVCLASLLRAFDVSLEENHPPVNFVLRTTVTSDIEIRLVLREASF